MYSITEDDVKIRLSKISKGPYLNEITCADPFR